METILNNKGFYELLLWLDFNTQSCLLVVDYREMPKTEVKAYISISSF